MSIESESAAQMFSKAERNYAVFFLPPRHHGRNVSFGNRLQLKAHLKAKQRCEREQKAGTDNSFASQLHKPRRHSRITLSFPLSLCGASRQANTLTETDKTVFFSLLSRLTT